MRNFLTLTGKSALRCFYPLTLFFNLAAVKKNWRGVFSFSRGAGHTYWNLKYFMFFVFYAEMKRDWGNSARVKNVFACANGNFFGVGERQSKVGFLP